jgi:hypothetical protein
LARNIAKFEEIIRDLSALPQPAAQAVAAR